MTIKQAAKLLKEYNKWRRGKGKKYSIPGFPFSVKEIGEAIDLAADIMSYCISPEGFITLVDASKNLYKELNKNEKTIDENKFWLLTNLRLFLPEASKISSKLKRRASRRKNEQTTESAQ